MKIQRIILLMALFFSTPFCLSAQDTINTNHCFSRAELLQLIHLSVSDPNNTDLMDILDAKGYQFGSDFSTRKDTLEYIEMEYVCHVYYDKVAGRLIPTIYVCESKDNLPNIVALNLTHNPECANELASDFHKGGYLYDGRRELYSGRDGLGDQNGIYEASYSDKNDISIIFRKQSEINNFVAQQKKKRTSLVEKLMKDATHYAGNRCFNKAYGYIDSAMGIYPPLDTNLIELRKQIHQENKLLFFEKLYNAVNHKEDLSEGIAWCDSLITLDPDNDSALQIRHLLLDQQNGLLQKYSDFNQDSYNQILAMLDERINQEIRQNLDKKKQTIDLSFEFFTTISNLSKGSISLDTDRGFLQSKNKERTRNQKLQSFIDSLASSGKIQPVQEYGIIINTQEIINAKIEWRYNEYEIHDGDKYSAELQSYMDTIEKHYFVIHDPSRADTALIRMPYLREYTFGITRKNCNEKNYSDVSLIDFSTSSPISWMSSLLIPGLGTVTQGYRSSVSSRAIPFFIFGGIAIAGYLLENNGKEKTSWNDGGQFWNHKNFGNILLYGGGAIATTIYITDLVQSIKATFQNRSRSKKIRKALKEGAIEIKMEDIHIQ